MVWRVTRVRIAAVILLLVASIPIEVRLGAATTTANGIADALAGAMWTLAGLIAWWRRPDARIGPVMICIGLLWFPPALRFFPDPPWLGAIGWIDFSNVGNVFLAWLLVTFPHMRLSSWVDRLLVGVTALIVTLLTWASLLFFDPQAAGCADCATNPLLIRTDLQLASDLSDVRGLLIFAVSGLAILRISYRLRRATPPSRKAIAPVLIASILLLVSLILVVRGDISGVTYSIAQACVPLAFLGGLLRTRATRSNLAELMVELGGFPEPRTLRDALARTLGDPSLEIGFPTPAGSYVDPAGEPFTPRAGAAVTDVPGRRHPAAILVHDPGVLDDEGLVESVAAAARLALDNARLQAEVRAQLAEVKASRQRIVEASAGERRRIERDLHDGVQQRLVALSLDLQILAESIGSPDAAARVGNAAVDIQGTIRELRELARGIHPPVLVQEGLLPALEALAERAPIPVRVEADPSIGRFCTAVEVAAYFTASECLTNALKHGGAAHVDMRLSGRDENVELLVEDDGRGGAYLVRGGGLAGLRDRAEALGGALTIREGDRGGTRVEVVLPAEPVPA